MRTDLKLVFSTALLAMVVAANASLDPTHESLEVMKEAQAGMGSYLGRTFGANPGNVMSFDYSMDPAGNGFFFTTQAGQSYRGMSLDVSAFGVRSGSESFTYGFQMDVGGGLVTGSGTGNFGDFDAGNSYKFDEKQQMDGSNDWTDRHGRVTWGQSNDGKWHSTAQYTYTKNDVPTGDGSGVDTWDPVRREWTWTVFNNSALGFNWNQTSNGGYQGSTWNGSFTSTITTVPEPSSIAAVGFAATSLLARRFKRRA